MLTTSDGMILAVDPGKKTGLAWMRVGDERPEVAQDDWLAAMQYVHARQNEWGVIVCESYIITAATLRKSRSSQNWSIEQIGILRYLALQRGIPFELQTPGQAKGFSTDTKLQRLGWWRPASDHAMDATRHLLLWLVRAGHLDPRRLIE